MSYEESRDVMSALKQRPPSLRVVFVTPEKIARSDALMRLLDSLHQQRQLVGTYHCSVPSESLCPFPVSVNLWASI